MSISFDGKTFRSKSNTANGEVGAETTFHYHQDGNVVWAQYAGGSVVRGSLIAVVAEGSSKLDMRYHHVNRDGKLMTGRCVSRPEVLPDGRLRMHETWKWTSGDESSGESIVEEVRE
ncbi:antigenic cell wall galactomannoprotein [Purpureocillium lavendulum]|uniref:Antigenic cell wall galactomannoprotein n=1 Tax=Purpureocillium lavendulum TaxID=1247861 RepID=A0AB34G2G3_9HYPO|nr:antigenic cell wall galactomannoprotein [Purpureocillium lavendulum]